MNDKMRMNGQLFVFDVLLDCIQVCFCNPYVLGLLMGMFAVVLKLAWYNKFSSVLSCRSNFALQFKAARFEEFSRKIVCLF